MMAFMFFILMHGLCAYVLALVLGYLTQYVAYLSPFSWVLLIPTSSMPFWFVQVGETSVGAVCWVCFGSQFESSVAGFPIIDILFISIISSCIGFILFDLLSRIKYLKETFYRL